MRERHVIDELRLELAFPDEAAAFDGQPRWETLLSRHLLTVADEVFANACGPGEVRRYERIEVDLGALPADVSTVETERRFREALLLALDRTPTEDAIAATDAPRMLSVAHSDLECLTHFLTHGRLPWHAATGIPLDPAALAWDVLHAHAGAFTDWLRQTPDRDHVVRRLVQQCGTGVAARLMAMLARTAPARIADLAGFLGAAFAEAPSGVGRSALDGVVHEAMLLALLSPGAATTDVAIFVRDAFKRIARRLGGTHAGTAAQVRTALARLQAMPPTSGGRRHAHEALRHAVDGGTSPPYTTKRVAANDPADASAELSGDVSGDVSADRDAEDADGTPEPDARDATRWSAALTAAFTRGNAAPVSADWPMLVRDHAPMLIDALRHHGRSTRHRRRMAAHLPLPMLRDLARLLAPAHGEFLDGLTHHPEWFDAAADVRALWFPLLGHLVFDAEARFDRGACLEAIVRDLADRAGVPVATWIAEVIGRATRPAVRDDASGAVLAMLQTLAAGPLASPSPARPATAGGDTAALVADEPPVQWPPSAQTSTGDGAPTDIGTPGAIDAIEQQIGGWLARGSVDAGDDTWPRMVAEHPAPLRTALRRMVITKGAPRAIEQVFTAPMVDDVVRLFAPAGAAFLSEVLHHPGRFDPGRGVGAPAQRARHVREFTLAYLLAERGSTFNNRMYLGNLVRRMAADSNLHYAEVLATLLGALAASPETSGVPREMLALLRSLAGDADLPMPAPDGRRPGNLVIPATREAATASAQANAATPRRPAPAAPPRARPANAPHHTPSAGTRRSLPPSPRRPVQPAKVDPTVADLTRVAVALARGRTIAAEDPACTDARVQRLLQSSPTALRGLFDRLLEDRHTIHRAVDVLPEPTLVRVLALLRPGPFAEARRCAEIVAEACADAGMGVTGAELRKLRWRFVFEHLVAEGRSFRLGEFVRGLLASIAARLPSIRIGRWRARAIERLRDEHLAAERGRVNAILAALAPDAGDRIERSVQPAATTIASPLPAPGEALQVGNAGMVIAAPYLPRLFGMLGLLAGNAFVDEAAAARAIHVLQFLVDGKVEPPEHLLILNKLLCGVPLDRPVPRDVALTDAERQAVEGLIAGMIGNWTAIGHTSVAGMRESFLQREGRITLERDAWKLLVAPRAFDMLLDRLPWSIATLRLPWMDRVLHVDWR
jgi:hypothetical protein